MPVPGDRRLQVVAVPDPARAACLAACSPTPPALAEAPALLACCLGPAAGEDPPGVELAAGGAVRTLVLGLHALGAVAAFHPAGPAGRPELAAALGLEPGWEPLGLLAAGRLGT